MITIGLIRELHFISSVLKADISIVLNSDLADPISIEIKNNIFKVSYHNVQIWKEQIEGDTSFFGVESCDAISRIIAAINNNDWETANQMIYSSDII